MAKVKYATTFTTALTPEFKKIKDYLSEYLQHNPEDSYWESVHRKLIMGKELTSAEIERAQGLMKSFDLNEAYVDSLLGDVADVPVSQEKQTLLDIIEQVESYEARHSGALKGWDRDFIMGVGKGWPLKKQFISRKGITDKQRAQLVRIAATLGIDTRGY